MLSGLTFPAYRCMRFLDLSGAYGNVPKTLDHLVFTLAGQLFEIREGQP
jgi:hypothetical protein